MQDLITTLTILLKYGNPKNPTNCGHDELYVNIDPEIVSEEDLQELAKLSFTPTEYEGFSSYRFGSC